MTSLPALWSCPRTPWRPSMSCGPPRGRHGLTSFLVVLPADDMTRADATLSCLQAVDVMGRQPYEMADSDDVRALLGGPDTRWAAREHGVTASPLQGLVVARGAGARASGTGSKLQAKGHGASRLMSTRRRYPVSFACSRACPWTIGPPHAALRCPMRAVREVYCRRERGSCWQQPASLFCARARMSTLPQDLRVRHGGQR